jgi:RNA polymerase sigma factor (TIGR02999 family)
MNPKRCDTTGDPELGWTPAVYAELHRMASGLMSGEQPGHTLQPTALLHEVWLRLRKSRNAESLEHGEFLGLASQAMRRILTDHARRRGTLKRGAQHARSPLEPESVPEEPESFVVDLDQGLRALETTDAQLVRIVELRFYGGHSVEEVAALLSLSPRTVKRRWRFARAWLQNYMQEERT